MIGESAAHTPETADAHDRRARGVALPGQRRAWGNWLIGFCAAALVLNALIGQNGYFESRRLERRYLEAHATLVKMRAENEALKAYAEALKSDPAAIEDVARRKLGLVKPGEILFIVTDTPSGAHRPAAPPARPAPDVSPARP